MDNKSCQSSGDSSITSSSSNSRSNTSSSSRDQYFKQLNKLSHKISKPLVKKPGFDPPSQPPPLNQNQNFNTQQAQAQQQQQLPPPPPPPQPAAATSQAQQQSSLQAQQHQHQPPVYNINKNDFRDVVQKLTGSPAHERFSTPPPPIHQPKPASSRLQRIRPPPLAQISNRPPPLLNGAVAPPPQPPFGAMARSHAPLSPLPPLPAVHASAESPVSAYMRYLQNSMSAFDPHQKQASGFSPRWSNLAPQQQNHPAPPPPPPQQQGILPPPPAPAMMASHSQFQLPTSPLPFGCLNSPRSPYPSLLSPNLLLSPSSGQLGFPQLPLSPTVPLPSPRWRGF